MSDLEVLLKSVPLYINLEEVQRLQAGPDPEAAVATAVGDVINQLAGELLAGVAAELASPGVQGCVKDAVRGEELRLKGNKAFSCGDYPTAVHHFSEALRFLGPRGPGGAAACAKVYCNRALCLSKLGLHHAAEDDATCAIEIDPGAAKAWYRRAAARGEQADKLAEAVEDAERAARLLREQDAGASVAEAEALLARLQLKAGGGGSEKDANVASEPTWTTHSVPQGLWDEDGGGEDGGAAVPAAANGMSPLSLEDVAELTREASLPPVSVGVAHEPTVGRQLVATAAVPSGTDLLRDRPVALALAKRQRLHRCARCCEELPMDGKLSWPCGGCATVTFCSRACRDPEGREGPHSEGGPECGVPWPVLLPPDVVLAVRLARRLRTSQPTAGDRAAAALSTHFADLSSEDAVHDATLAYAAHAAFSLAAERGGKICPPTITAGDVLRALCLVEVNGLAIVPRAFGGAREDSIGVALYPVASLMTHSCVPNVALRFEGAAAVVRAAAPLAAGEPLLHCYGPQAGEMTTAQRRAALEAQYHFRCECPACTAASPQTEAEMVGLRCGTAGCAGAVPVPCAASAGIASKYDYEPREGAAGGCTACGAALTEAEWNGRIEPRLTAALEAYSAGVEALEGAASADRQRGVLLLKKSLEAREELLHPHNQVLGATHAALGWVEEPGRPAQVAHCRAGLAAAEAVFPKEGTNVAFERLKLGTVLQQGGSKEGLEEGRALVGAAMAALERHFGPVGGNPLESVA